MILTHPLTKKQEAMLRRILIIVGTELVAAANARQLPTNWGELNHSSYTHEAMSAVYELMRKDLLLP